MKNKILTLMLFCSFIYQPSFIYGQVKSEVLLEETSKNVRKNWIYKFVCASPITKKHMTLNGIVFFDDVNFSHSDILGTNFKGCGFHKKASFSSTNSSFTHFTGSFFFEKPDFSCADCQNAEFNSVEFYKGADFSYSNCRGTDFRGTDLRNVNFSKTLLDGAKVGCNNRPCFTARVRLLNCLPCLTRHAYEVNDQYS